MFSLHLFESNADYNTARSTNYSEPWVSATNISENGDGGETPLYRVNYNKSEYEKLLETPLTFEITSDGSIYWRNKTGNNNNSTIQFRKNGGSWTTIHNSVVAPNIQYPNIDVVAGDIVEFRGDNSNYGTIDNNNKLSNWNSFSGSTCGFKVKGNIMSLINSEKYKDLNTFDKDATFPRLFTLCTGLTDASELILPVVAMTKSCYRNMFSDCPNLMFLPNLPATTLAEGCYTAMFARCTSLTTTPELPATTLAEGCYEGMFKDCDSLTTAPELPSTTLANNCYRQMFQGCTSLTTAPELLATILLERCYYQMFQNSIGLNYIKCLATDISATDCTTDWVSGVASSGTFVKNPNMSSWTTDNSGIPTNWTVQDV